jgi:hypothetical protein
MSIKAPGPVLLLWEVEMATAEENKDSLLKAHARAAAAHRVVEALIALHLQIMPLAQQENWPIEYVNESAYALHMATSRADELHTRVVTLEAALHADPNMADLFVQIDAAEAMFNVDGDDSEPS